MAILSLFLRPCLTLYGIFSIQIRMLATSNRAEAKSKPKKSPLLKTFKVYRYNPEGCGCNKPSMQSYTIDINDCRPTVLDALMKIKTDQDSSLSFRKSCREGICGSCGANIDGRNALLCLQKIRPKGVTKIYPLPHMYVIKDLIVDFKQFTDQHARIKPFLIAGDKAKGKEQYLQHSKDRDELIGLAECILCACCSTSCPEYWWHGHSKKPNDFLGPAALLHAYRWIMDSRDMATKERLHDLQNYYNVFRCHQINNCSTCCPKRLTPGKVIANLRLLVTKLSSKKQPRLHGTAKSDPLKACKDDKKKDCTPQKKPPCKPCS